MNKVIEDISKKTGYPPEAVTVVASTEGMNENDKDYSKILKSCVVKSLSHDSMAEFKLKTIADLLKIDHTEVLKAAVSCGARLSKDVGGEFWVVGNGLVRLINKINGVESPEDKAMFLSGRTLLDNGKKKKAGKSETGKIMEFPKEEENRQLSINDVFEAGTFDTKTEDEKMPRKAAVKEEVVEEVVEKKTRKRKAASEAAEVQTPVEEVKEPAKKAASKPASKSSKALLKSIVSSGSEMDVAKARKFLVQSKLKKVEEVAFMSDAEVSKIVNKDYAFITVGNGSESVNIAIPKEELKKIDLSSIAVI